MAALGRDAAPGRRSRRAGDCRELPVGHGRATRGTVREPDGTLPLASAGRGGFGRPTRSACNGGDPIMAWRGWLGRLLGGGSDSGEAEPAGEAVTYGEYLIVPKPIRQGGQFLTAGTITKAFPEGRKEHRFVRADTHASEEDARRFMVQKAQQLIDEVGDRLFTGG
jgi:hypothetical protein